MVRAVTEQRYTRIPAIYIHIRVFYSKTRANTPTLFANASVRIIAYHTEAPCNKVRNYLFIPLNRQPVPNKFKERDRNVYRESSRIISR
jgi:hypothetical protein